MSGIYIPNMKMPKRCWECFSLGFDYKEGNMVAICSRLKREIPAINLDKTRMIGCPLVEVPTHGDLKDANKILQWLNRICDEGQSVSVGEIIDYIEKAPIIIEDSEEKR